jgi:hypothetical protein
MSGDPDPKPVKAEKSARRSRDRIAVKQAALSDRECWGCGKDGANGHHLIPRDFEKPGPDEPWNIINLCGSGTSGCHGAFHGNPYTVEDAHMAFQTRGPLRITPLYVRLRIVHRLLEPSEIERLVEVMRFLGSSTLQERFFGRVLSLDDEQIDQVRRRHG